MTRFATSALLLFVFSLPVAASAPREIPSELLVAKFISAFVSDRMIALRDVAGTPTAAGATWGDLNDWIDGHHCFSIARYEWTIREQASDRAVIDVVLDATAVTSGAKRVDDVVPRRWRLDLASQEDGWKILGAQTRETELARDVIARQDAAPWDCFLQERDLDPEVFLVKIARNAPPGAVLDWAIGEARRINSPFALADALGAVVGAHNAPNPPLAKKFALESLQRASESGDDDAIAQAHLDAGMHEWNVDQEDIALEHFSVAANLIDQVRDPRAAIRASHLIGVINGGRSRHSAALIAGETTLKNAIRYGWEAGTCTSLFVLANLHVSLRNLEVAEALNRKVLRCSEERGHNGTAASALTNLASLMIALDRKAEAAPLLRRAIELSPGWLGDEAVATMHLLLGTRLLPDPKAEEEFLVALELGRKANDTISQMGALQALSELRFSQGHFQEALDHADEALLVSAKTGIVGSNASDEIQLWPVQTVRGRALRKLGRTAEAEAAFRDAVGWIELRRQELPAGAIRASFLEENLDAYRELADLLVDAKRDEDAATVADAMKARALHDLLNAGKVDFASHMTESERIEARRLEQEIERLNTLILQTQSGTTARTTLEEQRKRARMAIERFAAEVSLRRPGLLAQAVAARHDPLQTRAVRNAPIILHYLVLDARTTLFVLRRGKVEAHVLSIGRKELEEKIDRMLARIASSDVRYARDARDLHTLLLGPALPYLTDGTTISIIPDGVLWNVPFHALRGKDGRYVVERFAVHYAPSLAALGDATSEPRKPGDGMVLALGNPTIASETSRRARSLVRDVQLGSLPDAEEEVAAIGKIYGAGARVLTGARALESIAKTEAGKYDVLHFAAHAIADYRQPLYSGVVLAVAADDGEDGILEARELLGLDLRASLVVLAACSTGGGTVRAGEGLVGLSWAFLVAGCPRTVVTKWEVDSASTKTMMIDFHRRLRAGDSAPVALRKAQLRLMKRPRFADPLYWAPFIVLGTP